MKKYHVVILLAALTMPQVVAANPYAKLINGGKGTGCTEPFEKSHIEDLAKVTQLPSGIIKTVKLPSGLEYYAKTEQSDVLQKCAILDPGSEDGVLKLIYRKLWLTMTGKSDVANIDALELLGIAIPMIEFRLPGTPDVIEISEPLVFGDPEKKFSYAWGNGYVLSITSSPWNSWLNTLNMQLQAEPLGKPGEGLIPVSGPLPTIKAAANFKGECGVVLQQDMMLFSGIKLVGFPVGICVRASNVIVDRVEIDGSKTAVLVEAKPKKVEYTTGYKPPAAGGDPVSGFASFISNNDTGSMLIRSRITNANVGVGINGDTEAAYVSGGGQSSGIFKNTSQATFRVMGNIMTGVKKAVVIKDHARATVRRNQTGTAVIVHEGAYYPYPKMIMPKVSGIEVEDQGDEWAIMGSLENYEKSPAKYLTGDLYAYTPDSIPEEVRWVGRFGCFRWGADNKKLSNIPAPHQDPNSGVCTDNYNNRIAWVLPKSALSNGDHVFAIVTEGAQPFVASSVIFTSILGAPFAGAGFGYGGSGDPSEIVTVKDKQSSDDYMHQRMKIIPEKAPRDLDRSMDDHLREIIIPRGLP